MFCRSYRQLAGALWLSLYCMKCKRHVIALLYHNALAIVVEGIVGEMTMTLRWRSKAQDDDGHIMLHILIACEVYLLCILFCLVRR